MRTAIQLTFTMLSVAVGLAFLGAAAEANGPEFLESYLDPSNPQTIFAIYDSASPDGVYLLHSRDGGRIWRKVRGPTGRAVKKLGRQDAGDFLIDLGPPASPRLIITYGAEGLWRAGPDLQWQRYTAPGQLIVKLVATAHPDRFFAIAKGETGVALYLTSTGGASWVKLKENLPFDCSLGDCALAASPDGRVLVEEGYASRDGGRTWETIASDRRAKELAAIQQGRQGPWPIRGTPNQVGAAERAVSEQMQGNELQERQAPGTETTAEGRSRQRAPEGTFATGPGGSAETSSPESEVLSLRALGAVFKVSQSYGAVDKEVNPTPGGVHAGIDLAAPLGTAVRAVRDGTIINAGGPYGTVAVFDGQNTVLYLHMANINVLNLHKPVTASTYLGTVDRVGATGIHLHIEVRKGRQEVGVGCTKEEYRETPGKGLVPSPKGYCESSRRVADLTLDPVEYLVGTQQAGAAGPQPSAGTKEEGARGVSGPRTNEVRSMPNNYFLILSGRDTATGTTFWLPSRDGINRCRGDSLVIGEVPITANILDDTLARTLILKGYQVFQEVCKQENAPVNIWLVLEGYKVGTREGKPLYPAKVAGHVVQGAITYYTNMALEEERKKSQKDWHARWIEPFLRKYGVEVWIDTNDMKGRLASNPFQWKGKVVGFEAEFGGMLSEDSGIFDLGGFCLVVMKTLRSAQFTRTGEMFLLAGRVQGITQAALPLLGNVPVPELIFIGAEKAPPPQGN